MSYIFPVAFTAQHIVHPPPAVFQARNFLAKQDVGDPDVQSTCQPKS